jgi:hypothetical protein
MDVFAVEALIPDLHPSATGRLSGCFPVRQSKAENGPTASLTLCRLNQISLFPTQGIHMKGSTLPRVLFATVFVPMFAQPQLLQANPLSTAERIV